jgi:hypothetical protein
MMEQRIQAYGLLILRLTLGALFIAHLYWKFTILPGGVARWWSGLEANGYPWFVPWYVMSAEFAGAILLIPGICTRWVQSLLHTGYDWRRGVLVGAQGLLFHGRRMRAPSGLGDLAASTSVDRGRTVCGEGWCAT